MEDTDNYIVSFLNSQSSSLALFINRMLKIDSDSHEYQFCLEKIAELVSKIEIIIKKIGAKNIGPNDFFNYLYLLKDHKIEVVDKVLLKYNYEAVIKASYSDAINEMINGDLPKDSSKKTIEFLISNSFLPKKDRIPIFEYYMRYFLLKERPFSYEIFSKMMVDYAKEQVKEFEPNIEVVIKPTCDLDGKLGYCESNLLELCSEDLKSMYYDGFFRPIKTIFHEKKHFEQKYDILTRKEESKRVLIMVKDDILARYNKSYYIDNYERLFSELEAEIFSIEEIIKLFSRLKIHFKNDKNPYADVIERLKQEQVNNKRFYHGEEVSIDEAFDEVVVNHPECLDDYPQLNIYYKVEYGDLVVRRDF